MQESMMMALTGGMAKVSGSRMAMPFAPPRPGSTPMSTPSTTPTSISSRFSGCSATAKPCSSRPISSIPGTPRAAGLVAEPFLDRALRERDEEPDLEDDEGDDGGGDPRRHRAAPREAAEA